MFGIGGFELFLILLFGFLIFGPDKLPAIAKTLGKGIAKFRDAQEEMSESLKKQSFIDKDAEDPFKNPLDVIEKAASDAKAGAKAARKKADEVTEAVTASVAGSADDTKDTGTDTESAEAISTIDARSASFAERKAQYDRERARRKEAERAAAEQARAEADSVAEAAQERRDNPVQDLPKKGAAEAGDE